MKIAIIGSGNIGGGLARAWAKKHSVVMGVRDPRSAKLQALQRELGVSAATMSEAAGAAEVVVLAMPADTTESVLEAVGPLAGKVVIDCTNAVDWGQGTLKYGLTTSWAEELQKKIPQAKLYKSFNAQGAENLTAPVYGGTASTNFFCGDDPDGKQVVRTLVEDVGFEAQDVGPLKSARFLEPLMMLWVSASKTLGTRDIAFKLLRR